MVNTELHCVQLSIQYMCDVTTLMIDKLLCAVVYYRTVHCLLRIVKQWSEVFDRSVRMLSITVVLGCHGFGLRI
jgi:hypothetical protein